MYANFVDTCPSITTGGHRISRLPLAPSSPTNTTRSGLSRSKSTHLRMLLAMSNSVEIIPTCSVLFLSTARSRCSGLDTEKSLDSAMWCSARTRRDIRETSMRLMNASSSSGGRYGEDSESPSESAGMTAALRTASTLTIRIHEWEEDVHTVRPRDLSETGRTSRFPTRLISLDTAAAWCC
jgi:hypothetical protein